MSDDISETVQVRDLVMEVWKTTRKSYAAYQMASITMTLSDHEGHFSYLKPF